MSDGKNLTAASSQWATRPADERFWNVGDLAEFCRREKSASHERTVKIGHMVAIANGPLLALGNRERMDAKHLTLTNWSGNLLCSNLGMAGGVEELGKYPTELAAKMLNHRMEAKKTDNAELLFTAKNGGYDLRAITSDRYERLWDADLADGLAKISREQGWVTPPARPYPGGEDDSRTRAATPDDVVNVSAGGGVGISVGDLIQPAGVYRGVKDMFVFLINPGIKFDDGNSGLTPGLFIRNSEVRGGSFSVTSFLLEGVCGNHIVWGAHDVKKTKFRHIGKSMVANAGRKLALAFDADVIGFESTLKSARAKELGKDREAVFELVTGKKVGLTLKAAEGAWMFAEKWEHTAHAAPTTAWGFVHGLTRYSQTVGGFADKRADLDAFGGKIIALAI